MKILEKIFGILVIVSIIMKMFNVLGSGILFTLATSSLMLIYFYIGFAIFNNITFKGIFIKASYKDLSVLRIIGSIAVGMAFSTILTGILFRLQHWPGANLNLATGLILSSIILVIGLIRYLKNKDNFYRNIFLRFILIGGFGLILFFTTDFTIDKIRYRNYPDYIKAIENLQKDPNNEALKKKANYEYNKIFFTAEEMEYMNMNDNKE